MRKIYLLLFLLVPSILAAQSKREIHLSAPGTLPEHITDAEKYTIEELTVSGNVNGTDMRLLRDMAGNNWQGQLTEGKLQWLDLSEANIVAGGEKYVDTDKIYYDKQGTWKDNISFNTTDNVFPPYAFMGCNSLKVISLPKTVTEIGHCAFALGMLTSVTIPNGVRIIGKQAFYDCAHLAEFPMPESLTSLGIYALAYCTGLTKITLPAGLTEIGKNAFSGATALKEVWSYIKTPFTIVQKTFAVYEQATLYVPTGSKSLYQETEAWNMFQKIEEFNPTTGIVSMTLPASFDVYNVQGCRKLQHATSTASLSPGMYIINGRKFLKK